MSSPLKLFILASVLMALNACGFEPVYGKHSSSRAGHQSAADLEAISLEVSSPDETLRRGAEVFKAKLEDLLRPSGSRPPLYHFTAGLIQQEVAVAISRDGTVSRYNTIVEVHFRVVRLSDGQEVFKGITRRTGSYNNPVNAFYSTYVSREDSIQRTIEELAEDVRMRLAGHFNRERAAPAP